MMSRVGPDSRISPRVIYCSRCIDRWSPIIPRIGQNIRVGTGPNVLVARRDGVAVVFGQTGVLRCLGAAALAGDDPSMSLLFKGMDSSSSTLHPDGTVISPATLVLPIKPPNFTSRRGSDVDVPIHHAIAARRTHMHEVPHALAVWDRPGILQPPLAAALQRRVGEPLLSRKRRVPTPPQQRAEESGTRRTAHSFRYSLLRADRRLLPARQE